MNKQKKEIEELKEYQKTEEEKKVSDPDAKDKKPTKRKDGFFSLMQRVGRSFMLPIAILPVAGLLLGFGSSFTNETTIEAYNLTRILGKGTILYALFTIMSEVGGVIFDNLPLIFAVGTAIGMAKREKEVAALSAVIAYFVMNIAVNAMLILSGQLLDNGVVAENVTEGTIVSVCGIQTLQMGVFGGIIVGIGVAALHNRYYRIELPSAISFFSGTRFVPIISTIVYMLVGIVMYFVWPQVQNVIYALGNLVTGSGFAGTLIFGLIKRALIPFGLHHVFYMPFWQTAVGGSMEVAGRLVQGGQNIFFAQLANASDITHFSSDATRYFSGEFIFMIFGLPGAALAMYQCARKERKKQAGGLLFSASIACILTGITEPLEFSFLFTAPLLFVVQVVLAGTAYMVAHMLNIAVGLTFSGGFIDLFLFGILQGNEKTSWMLIIPVGIIYFLLYYIIFFYLIQKFNLKTPGREDEQSQTRLYTKEDVKTRHVYAKTLNDINEASNAENTLSGLIVAGLGEKDNISDIDCCATRLRISVNNPQKVNTELLKQTGASGVIKKGNGIQIIYGPRVSVIKSNLEEHLNAEIDAEKLETKNIDKKSKKNEKDLYICSPVSGSVISLDDIEDEAFSSRLAGDGAAVMPESDIICAPIDAGIAFIFDTGHAIGFEAEDGTEILVHVGIDTVKLKGNGFSVLVSQGDKVRKGEPCIRLDLDYIRQNAKSAAVIVLVTDIHDNGEINVTKDHRVKEGEVLFTLEKCL